MKIKDVLDNIMYQQSIKVVDDNCKTIIKSHLYEKENINPKIINIIDFHVKCLTIENKTLVIHTYIEYRKRRESK